MSNSYDHKLNVDSEIGNGLWNNSSEKKRSKVKDSLKLTDCGDLLLSSYKKTTGNYIYGVKK